MNSIFRNVYHVQWREAKSKIKCSNIYTFQGITSHTKNPLVLVGEISQFDSDFEIDIPSYTLEDQKISVIEYEH